MLINTNAKAHSLEIFKNSQLINKWFALPQAEAKELSINSCKQMIEELKWLHSKQSDNNYLDRINHYENVIKELNKL
jgi:hypothetical protein